MFSFVVLVSVFVALANRQGVVVTAAGAVTAPAPAIPIPMAMATTTTAPDNTSSVVVTSAAPTRPELSLHGPFYFSIVNDSTKVHEDLARSINKTMQEAIDEIHRHALELLHTGGTVKPLRGDADGSRKCKAWMAIGFAVVVVVTAIA